ncbi:MAG TPA: DUF3106 domain-containing protein, partial [Denitromonas sp.]|nr:DUF3106 domain-containing protein [Denitromonas sp.]
SPNERAKAVDQYRALRRIPPEQREALQQRWQEYQELSPEARDRALKDSRKTSRKDRKSKKDKDRN